MLRIPIFALGFGITVFSLGCWSEGTDSPGGFTAANQPTAVAPSTPSTAECCARLKAPFKPGNPTLPQLVEISPDYHAEIVLARKGAINFYTLGKTPTHVHEVEIQKISAQVKIENTSESIPVILEAKPQPDDSPGKTSLFTGKLPQIVWGKPLVMTVPLRIDKQRFRVMFPLPYGGHDEDDMPVKLVAEEEKELYLTAAGKYTEADIEANGRRTASQKYDISGWPHELRPRSGEKICPITLTKANPNCSWVINGQVYEFCCPPCIDAFVDLAKTMPEATKEPGEYRKK